MEPKRITQPQQLINSRYRVLRKLGEGAMGAVLLVLDTLEDGDQVALKQIRPDIFSPESRDAFRNEFRAMTQLRHPNVVEVYDFGAIGGSTDHFFTMEYVEGENLLQACEGKSEETVYDFALQITRALEYIHAQGFIHFDLKPDNIMVRRDGVVKVMDFGLVGKASHLPHALKGTVHYIPPEMARGEPVDARADLYSLGALMFHVFARRTVFEGDTVSELLRQHRDVMPDLTSRVARQIPDSFARVLTRLLEKKPDGRHPSASALRLELESLPLVPKETPARDSGFVLGSRFLGREDEIHSLKEAFRSRIIEASSTEPMLLLVGGAKGIGKSRLLAEFRHYVQLHGAKFYQGACLFSRELPFLPLREILRAIVREILPPADEPDWEAPDSVPHDTPFVSTDPPCEMPAVAPGHVKEPAAVPPGAGRDGAADTVVSAVPSSEVEPRAAAEPIATVVVPSSPTFPSTPARMSPDIFQTLSSASGEASEPSIDTVLQTGPLVEVVRAHAAALSKLLGNEPGLSAFAPSQPAFAQPEQEKEWLLGSLCRFLFAIARELPMVLYCVDLQWADELTAELLARLARGSDLQPGQPAPRLLVCGCYRDEEIGGRPLEAKLAALFAEGLVRRLTLAPFNRVEVGAMVRSMLGPVDLPTDALELLTQRTLGRPLFIEETVRGLIRNGSVNRDGTNVSISLSPLCDGGELADLDGIFDGSFETIEPAEFEVLSLLSVFNRPVTLRLLRPAAALPFDALAPLMATLRRKGFVQRVWSEGEHLYNVRHHHVRDQIYAGLTVEVAERLHGRALEAIELVHRDAETYLEDLAHHALRSQHLEKGIRFTRLAADHARRLYDSQRATMLYLRAHGLVHRLERSIERDKLEIGLAIAIASASYYSASEENIERLEQALDLAIQRKDVEAEAGVHNAMGRTYYGLGRQREAIPCFREYIRLTEGKGNDMTRALPYSVLGRVYFFLGKFGDAADYLERASALFERQKGADEELSYALGMKGSAMCYLGDLDRGLAHIDRSIAVAQRIGHETRLALGHTYRGICLANHGNWPEARKWLEDGMERSKRTGDVIAIGTGSSFLGLTYLMEGRVERAIELCRFGQEQIAGRGGTWTFTMICSHLIEALLSAGHLDLAEEQEALGRKVLDTGERWGESCLAVAFAHLRAARHDERAAIDWLQRAVSAANEQRALPFLAKALLARGIHLAERGAAEQGREDLETARRLLERLSMSYHEKKAILALSGEHVTACL